MKACYSLSYLLGACILLVVGLSIMPMASSFAAVPQLINYQGKLTKATGAPLDTTISMVFTIYADSGGVTSLWTETQNSVKVEKGVFNVLLGSVNPISYSVFDGTTRYLGVKVGADPEITPRKAMVSIAYAYKSFEADTAGYARGADVVINCHDCDTVFVNIIGPDSVMASSGTAFKGNASGSYSGGMIGIRGYATNTSFGSAHGGYFDTDSSGSGVHYGIQGFGRGNSYQSTYGVYGNASNNGNGQVYGGFFRTDSLGTGTHFGVYGEAYSSNGPVYGGYFLAPGFGTGIRTGVRGEGYSFSSDPAYGAFGVAQNYSSGPACGGYFYTYTSASATGENIGVYAYGSGNSLIPFSFGVKGMASSSYPTGATYGVFGTAENSNNTSGSVYGGCFDLYSPSNTGLLFGVSGWADNHSSASTFGCRGFASNASSGTAIGGLFSGSNIGIGTGTCMGVQTAGVCSTTYSGYGVFAEASNKSSGSVYGGKFHTYSYGTGTKYGVYADAPVDQGWAGYFEGDVRITDSLVVLGGKSAAVRLGDGNYHLFYSQESPEVWFEDFGEGQLVNGRAHIELDPLFLQSVTVNSSNPLKVFIQLNDENCKGTAVKRGLASFDVIELQGGKSNASFSYRLVAKRKGFENLRLPIMRGPTPEEVAAEQVKELAEMNKLKTELEQEQRIRHESNAKTNKETK